MTTISLIYPLPITPCEHPRYTDLVTTYIIPLFDMRIVVELVPVIVGGTPGGALRATREPHPKKKQVLPYGDLLFATGSAAPSAVNPDRHLPLGERAPESTPRGGSTAPP